MNRDRKLSTDHRLLDILSISGTGVTTITLGANNIIYSNYIGATGATSSGTRYFQWTVPNDCLKIDAIRIKTLAPLERLPSSFTATLWANGATDSSINASSVLPGSTGSTAHTFNLVPATAPVVNATFLLGIAATCFGATAMAEYNRWNLFTQIKLQHNMSDINLDVQVFELNSNDDYTIRGYFKKKTFDDRGFLIQVEYYLEYDEETGEYSKLMVKEERIYYLNFDAVCTSHV